MKHHYMCTHTFLSDETKKSFEDASGNLTDRDIFSMLKNDKAEMLAHWRGDDDFFFCHWYAESEDAIFDNLSELGFNSLMNTMPNKMNLFVSSEHLTDKIMSEIRS